MKNSILDQFTTLDNSVSIYIPSTIDVNVNFDNAKHVNTILVRLSEIFGGCTSSQGVGCWKSENEGLVKESVTICKSFCTSEQLEKEINSVVGLCNWLKAAMSQEAISLEVNGKLYFI